MTGDMNRRTLLGAIAGTTVLAGCLGDDDESDTSNGSTATDGNESESEDEDLTEDEIIVLFKAILEEEGIESPPAARVETEDGDDVLELVYPATGETDEDAAAEIVLVSDVYGRAVDAELTTDRLEAFVRDPDSETVLDSYRIETDWVAAYLDDEIDWDEYVERVIETFEATEEPEE